MNTAGLRGPLHIRVKFANFFEKVKSLGEVSDFSRESRAHNHFRLIQLPVCNESIMQLCSSAVDDVSQYPLIDFSLKYAPTPVPVRLCLAC